MKRTLISTLLCLLITAVCSVSDVSASHEPEFDLYKVMELSLDAPIGQLRAVPLRLGSHKPPAILVIYSEDAEIDPYIGMFFFPKGTTKLLLFSGKGDVLWKKDLGPGMVSGIWFLPKPRRLVVACTQIRVQSPLGDCVWLICS